MSTKIIKYIPSLETRHKMSLAAQGNKRALGFKHSIKNRKKMSLRLIGNKINAGRIPSKKSRQLMSLSHLGSHRNEKTKRKMSLAHRGKNNAMYGTHKTKEQKEKIRNRMLGKNNHFYGKKHTPETIEKIKLSHMLQKRIYKDTNIEKMIHQELKTRNIEYKKQMPLYGRPDIFIEPNICIFADGKYWHTLPGRQERDWDVTKKLTEQNFFVLRFWEDDIKNNINSIGDKIETLLRGKI